MGNVWVILRSCLGNVFRQKKLKKKSRKNMTFVCWKMLEDKKHHLELGENMERTFWEDRDRMHRTNWTALGKYTYAFAV